MLSQTQMQNWDCDCAIVFSASKWAQFFAASNNFLTAEIVAGLCQCAARKVTISLVVSRIPTKVMFVTQAAVCIWYNSRLKKRCYHSWCNALFTRKLFKVNGLGFDLVHETYAGGKQQFQMKISSGGCNRVTVAQQETGSI
jgi:hypothetical protein